MYKFHRWEISPLPKIHLYLQLSTRDGVIRLRQFHFSQSDSTLSTKNASVAFYRPKGSQLYCIFQFIHLCCRNSLNYSSWTRCLLYLKRLRLSKLENVEKKEKSERSLRPLGSVSLMGQTRWSLSSFYWACVAPWPLAFSQGPVPVEMATGPRAPCWAPVLNHRAPLVLASFCTKQHGVRATAGR